MYVSVYMRSTALGTTNVFAFMGQVNQLFNWVHSRQIYMVYLCTYRSTTSYIYACT